MATLVDLLDLASAGLFAVFAVAYADVCGQFKLLIVEMR